MRLRFCQTDHEEATAPEPLIVEPIEVKVPAGPVNIDVGDIAVAMQFHDRAAQTDHRIPILLFGMTIEEGLGLGTIREADATTKFDLIEHFLCRRFVVEPYRESESVQA